MELLLALAVIGIVGLLGPLVAWSTDENNGRSRWVRMLRTTESFALGVGAFRGARVDVEHERLLRDRAPTWVRTLAFTCYLPLGAALLSGIPWLIGVLFVFERNAHAWGFDLWANALLVAVYPFGCWAAARMYALGGALMSGERPRFQEALAGATMVVVPLNVAIVVGAVALMARFGSADGVLLLLAPAFTLTQFALVSAAGRRYLADEPATSPAPGPRPLDAPPA